MAFTVATTPSQIRWKADHPENTRKHSKSWKERNPEKVRAQRAVAKAIIEGVLVRPAECEDCGRYDGWYGEDINIHAHHTNYTKPLDVEWLCRQCHGSVTTKSLRSVA